MAEAAPPQEALLMPGPEESPPTMVARPLARAAVRPFPGPTWPPPTVAQIIARAARTRAEAAGMAFADGVPSSVAHLYFVDFDPATRLLAVAPRSSPRHTWLVLAPEDTAAWRWHWWRAGSVLRPGALAALQERGYDVMDRTPRPLLHFYRRDPWIDTPVIAAVALFSSDETRPGQALVRTGCDTPLFVDLAMQDGLAAAWR